MPDRSIGARQLAPLLAGWSRDRPVYRTLAAHLQALVLDGRIPLRTRLPAERELADALGVSRTTLTAAYDTLRETGYLESRRGAGSWTALPPHRRRTPHDVGLDPSGDLIDLAVAAPTATTDVVLAATERAVDRMGPLLAGHGLAPHGLPELRAALAERFTARGLPTRPDEVLVTAGAQHALGLLLDLVTRPGDRVLVESPTYPNALTAVHRRAARPVPVPVLPAGWDLPMVEATLRQSAPRLAYVIADYHNPTGRLAGDDQRAALVAAARRSGTLLVVDETLADLALDPVHPVRPLAAYDGSGRTVTIGSASKTYWGGLRLGWVRGPAELIRELADRRAASDLASPPLEQLVLAELLALGAAPIDQRRAQLREQRSALAHALRARLPQWRFRLPPGGLSVWAELPTPVASALAAAARDHGVRLLAGPRFGVDGTMERYVRLPFALPPESLSAAVERLAAAYAAVSDAPGRLPDEELLAV